MAAAIGHMFGALAEIMPVSVLLGMVAGLGSAWITKRLNPHKRTAAGHRRRVRAGRADAGAVDRRLRGDDADGAAGGAGEAQRREPRRART